ncbi:hypothetical protein K435DRAFT_785469 [Dendrothele bispora CBS 962.96]|uniref:Uncharacterized protein n=1 Tax=Dendrothele bispora (strain CBS 962.96) TaxID=1314807 RepID=A0A4S8KWM6_DENBC|nr:hypothetical protein K435DRAFT_785469 [Dendrothele bispora CBS 962.96]
MAETFFERYQIQSLYPSGISFDDTVDQQQYRPLDSYIRNRCFDTGRPGPFGPPIIAGVSDLIFAFPEHCR